MKLENYILTLDFIEQHCLEVMGEWDGNESGGAEERADTAQEILGYVVKIKTLLTEL